jgi:hypothetical protein
MNIEPIRLTELSRKTGTAAGRPLRRAPDDTGIVASCASEEE